MTTTEINRKLDALREDPALNLRPSTRRLYDCHWRMFVEWCEANGHEALPATEDAVLGHLFARHEDGVSHGTLRASRNAIAYRHGIAGLPKPTKTERVREALRLLARKARAEGRVGMGQAPPILLHHIQLYEDTGKPGPHEEAEWTPRDERRYLQACALLRVMHCALLRRGEAAALRWGDIRPAQQPGRALLTIRKSKTSDEPMVRLLTAKAVARLEAIKPPDVDPEARVFGVTTGRAIQYRIKAAMERIVPGCRGHSLRVGGAHDLTMRGASLHQVKEAGGWKTLTMPAYYASKVEAEVGAVRLLED